MSFARQVDEFVAGAPKPLHFQTHNHLAPFMSIHPLDRPPDDDEAASGGRRKPLAVSARVIRLGVWGLIAGIAATAIGAAFLGQGPGSMEQPGDVLHRAGMVATLASLVVIFVGYRWESLVRLFDPPLPAGPAARDPFGGSPASVRELLETMPLPPGSLGNTSPVWASGSTNEESVTMSGRSESGSPWMESTRVESPRIGKVERGLLIVAWPLLGLLFVCGGVLFWILPLYPAFLLASFLDLTLAAAVVAGVIVARGSRRALLCGILLPLLLILFVELPLLLNQFPNAYWGGPYGMMGGGMNGAMQWKIAHVALHLLLPMIGCVSWIVARSIESMQGGARPRRSESQ